MAYCARLPWHYLTCNLTRRHFLAIFPPTIALDAIERTQQKIKKDMPSKYYHPERKHFALSALNNSTSKYNNYNVRAKSFEDARRVLLHPPRNAIKHATPIFELNQVNVFSLGVR